MAESLAGMDHVKRIFVVHGASGWDEATPIGRFELYDVQPGRVHHEVRDPRDAGIKRCTEADLAGGNAANNAQALEEVLLQRDRGPHRDALVLGTGLLLEVTGRANTFSEGVRDATKALDDGRAEQLLKQLRAFSESLE